jgi:hypothetical protein
MLIPMADNPQIAPVLVRTRHVLAWPLYLISLILSYVSDLLGDLAARIAGDDWPR